MISIAIPPYAEPVHLLDMKNHLKSPVEVTEDDALIPSQTSAARDVVETATGANTRRHRVMVVTTFELTLTQFPACGSIEVPRVPLVSVASITYVDTAGVTQTLSASVYSVDAVGGRIWLAYLQAWPATRNAYEDRVTVTFVAGTMAPFTVATATETVTPLGRSFSTGDRVRLLNSGGALPAGLSANTDYFLIAGPKLSLTAGGSAVDITGTGTGTHFMGLDVVTFENMRAAVKLETGKLYVNRGDGGYSGMGSIDNTQRTIDSLVAASHA